MNIGAAKSQQAGSVVGLVVVTVDWSVAVASTDSLDAPPEPIPLKVDVVYMTTEQLAGSGVKVK